MIHPIIKKSLEFIEGEIFEQESGEYMMTINDDTHELYAVFFHAGLEWEEDGTKVCAISNLRMDDGNLSLKCRCIDLIHLMQLLSELTELKSKNSYTSAKLFEEYDGPFEPIAEFHPE